MDIIGLLFWLLFFSVIAEPLFEYQRIKAARLSLLKRIEDRYGYRVITLIHRQERVGFFGVPIYRFIDIEDSEAVVRAIRSTPKDKPIMLILHTPGGMVLAASQIAHALHKHPAKTVAVVPHYAMSGGTLIAIAADEIWMDPAAALGPLDPQIPVEGQHLPAPSLVKVLEEKGKEASDKFLVYGDVARKALQEMYDTVVKFLSSKMEKEQAEKVAEELVMGKYTHDYPLFYEKVKELGLPVKDKIPPEVYELMELYPQAQTQRPGVEYLPQLPKSGKKI